MHRQLIYFIFAVLLTACVVSPTGRKQLVLFSNGQMSQMGATAYDSMKKEQKVNSDKKVNAYVSCISNALLKHLPGDLAHQNWEVTVFKDDSPNAFALPGAKIGVHTGMLKVASTQGQLAAVVGHEIGHVWANHGNERMSQQSIAQMGMQIVTVLAGEPSAEKQMALSALGVATQGTVLKFSRDQEKEADVMGLEMMAKAGFDPQQAVALWEKMAQQSGAKRVPEFMSTHPSEETRIRKLKQQLPNVVPLYQQAKQKGVSPRCQS